MAYTVRSSEKLRKSGADGETKALLYLMNFRADSDEIHYFVVDFFNDLTGMDRYSEKLWDVQSKAKKDSSPREIGKELVTLYKNYISDLDFAYYILFLGGCTNTLRKDPSLTTFGTENIKPEALVNIIVGLKEEAFEKTYIDNAKITDELLFAFLEQVTFVVDDKKPCDYVREIIKNHAAIIPNDTVLQAIFNEIRNKQSEKKNTVVEGVTINASAEALNYCRHLTNNEIRLLTLHRIINQNPVSSTVPQSFIPIYITWPPENQKDMFDECKQSMCRALFNKNLAEAFWNLFENIYSEICANPSLSVEEIYRRLDADKRRAETDFDVLSLKFFIAVVKDGILLFPVALL